MTDQQIQVVAFGGGHGLAASLTALKNVGIRPTAVVGVSDNGGSSGRLRRDFAVIPPGDLRMALTALCADSTWGRSWAGVLQHRFAGEGELAGHALGNLLITALWQQQDVVSGLRSIAELLDCQGVVLPLSLVPLDIVAEVEFTDGIRIVSGQVEVATTSGRVVRVDLEPSDAEPTAAAIEAVQNADLLVFGPGSWFTSVLTHFALPVMRQAILASTARKILIANLTSQSGETEGFSASEHLSVLHRYVPELRVDAVFVDRNLVNSEVEAAVETLGARLISEDFSETADRARHDVVALGNSIVNFLSEDEGSAPRI